MYPHVQDIVSVPTSDIFITVDPRTGHVYTLTQKKNRAALENMAEK